MFVGVCKLTFRLDGVGSLKEKRQHVKKIIARIENRFPVSIAETGLNDQWQRAEIGFSVAGNESPFVNSVVDKVIDYAESLQLGEIINSEIEIIHL